MDQTKRFWIVDTHSVRLMVSVDRYTIESVCRHQRLTWLESTYYDRVDSSPILEGAGSILARIDQFLAPWNTISEAGCCFCCFYWLLIFRWPTPDFPPKIWQRPIHMHTEEWSLFFFSNSLINVIAEVNIANAHSHANWRKKFVFLLQQSHYVTAEGHTYLCQLISVAE